MARATDPAVTARNRLDRAGAKRADLDAAVAKNRTDMLTAARAAHAAGVDTAEIARRLGIERRHVVAMTRTLLDPAPTIDAKAIPRGAVIGLVARSGGGSWRWDATLGDDPDDVVATGRCPFHREILPAARKAVAEVAGHAEFTITEPKDSRAR